MLGKRPSTTGGKSEGNSWAIFADGIGWSTDEGKSYRKTSRCFNSLLFSSSPPHRHLHVAGLRNWKHPSSFSWPDYQRPSRPRSLFSHLPFGLPSIQDAIVSRPGARLGTMQPTGFKLINAGTTTCLLCSRVFTSASVLVTLVLTCKFCQQQHRTFQDICPVC